MNRNNGALLQTMESGNRPDALHWLGTSATLYSTEKLLSILRQAELYCELEELVAIKKELENRV
jgi:hypothetical protein